MESKHTSGPWIAFPSNVRLSQLGAHDPTFDDGRWIVLPEGDVERLPIAEIDKGDDWDAPTRARAEFDARLIAASPTMLEVLLRIYSFGDLNGEDYDAVRDVIAKATGGAE